MTPIQISLAWRLQIYNRKPWLQTWDMDCERLEYLPGMESLINYRILLRIGSVAVFWNLTHTKDKDRAVFCFQ